MLNNLNDRQKKILIISSIFLIGLFILMVVMLSVNNQNRGTHIDPITGLTIIDSDTNPEHTDQNMKPPAIIGFGDVSSALGNPNAYSALVDFMHTYYHQYSFVKMKKGSLSNKESTASNGENVANLTFYVYLDNDTSTRYTFTVAYNLTYQNSMDITVATENSSKQQFHLSITPNNPCGSSGSDDILGFNGFDGSFNPDGWQIDSSTLDTLKQALMTVISSENTEAAPGKKVICVNATQNKSNATTDTKNYISTFTLQVQFITDDGTLTTHIFTFATGPNYYRSYTLDGQNIQQNQ